MSTHISTLSAIALTNAYRQRSLSPIEVVKASLERIAAYELHVNAFALLDEEKALADARASEERWRKGEPLGLIDGIPTTVKDLLLTKGWATRRGSKAISPDQPWDEDAPAVAHLRSQGAVFLGKTTTSEFGWKGVTDSPLTGITRNPWNLDRTPGGSSGGAAVAAALGLGTLHLSTDGGGSTRLPAAFTGVFGFKPTFGRVPGYPSAHTTTLFHIGATTRSALDAREALGRQFGLFHQTYDLLLTPTLPITAFPVGQASPQSDLYPSGLNWTPFTYPFNLTQQPAASVPCGFTQEGLPVGLQIIGAKYQDALVLQAARAYETVHRFKMPEQVATA